jgi:uncharacterized membrane protein YtjA (UPF0391 family)
LSSPAHLSGDVVSSGIRLALVIAGRRRLMLWTLIVLLLLFWLLGFAFDVAGGIIHVLLVIAVVLFLVNLFTGRRTVI